MFWIEMFVHVLADDWGARPDNSRPSNWGFPKIRGTFLGVPLIRITVINGSRLRSPYLGKLPIKVLPIMPIHDTKILDNISCT